MRMNSSQMEQKKKTDKMYAMLLQSHEILKLICTTGRLIVASFGQDSNKKGS